MQITFENLIEWRACYEVGRLRDLFASPKTLREVLTLGVDANDFDAPWCYVPLVDRVWVATRALPEGDLPKFTAFCVERCKMWREKLHRRYEWYHEKPGSRAEAWAASYQTMEYAQMAVVAGVHTVCCDSESDELEYKAQIEFILTALCDDERPADPRPEANAAVLESL